MKQCNRCGELKPESAFSWRYKARGIRQPTCKSCKAEQDRNWYVTRGRAHKERQIANTNRRRQEARAYLYDYLSSHPCVDCGEADPEVLEFDHVRGQKFKSVARMLREGYSVQQIAAEIEKCDVRCANCHRRKTNRESGSWRLG